MEARKQSHSERTQPQVLPADGCEVQAPRGAISRVSQLARWDLPGAKPNNLQRCPAFSTFTLDFSCAVHCQSAVVQNTCEHL